MFVDKKNQQQDARFNKWLADRKKATFLQRFLRFMGGIWPALIALGLWGGLVLWACVDLAGG